LRSKLSIEILKIILIALVVSVGLSVAFNYYGEPYFSPESQIIGEEEEKNPDLTAKDLVDDKGDFFEISFNVSIIIGFSFFIYYFINKKALYITDISNGLDIIGGGKLDYEIEVKGNDEIASLAESINSMSQALMTHIQEERKILQSEQRLITGISHDLRAPLSSIIGYMYVLKDKQYRTVEEQEKYVSVVLEKSLRLQGLLDDLLEMAKLQEKDMTIQTYLVDVNNFKEVFVDYLATELKDNCPNVSDIIVEYSDAFEYKKIYINNMFTYRVLDNAISNIYKYAMINHPVEIAINDQGDFVELQIANVCDDNTLEQADQLTERFFKVDNSRTAEDGSGLGLNICMEIMEKQDGYLNMRTNNDKNQIIVVLGFRVEK